jgi:hypothetical protein
MVRPPYYCALLFRIAQLAASQLDETRGLSPIWQRMWHLLKPESP